MIRRGPVLRCQRGGISWELDLREGIDFSIWLLGGFERRVRRRYRSLLRAGDTVLDIGANIGAHTLPLAVSVGSSGRVIAFEPTSWAIGKLLTNLRLNPTLEGRVIICQTMLVETADTTLPEALPASWPVADLPDVHPKLRSNSLSTEGAEASPLDDVLERLDVARVDLIKLDVDGYETGVLRGAQRTLVAYRPPIIMEISPYIAAERGYVVEDILGELTAASYLLTDLVSGAKLPLDADALRDQIADGASVNVLARPDG